MPAIDNCITSSVQAAITNLSVNRLITSNGIEVNILACPLQHMCYDYDTKLLPQFSKLEARASIKCH